MNETHALRRGIEESTDSETIDHDSTGSETLDHDRTDNDTTGASAGFVAVPEASA